MEDNSIGRRFKQLIGNAGKSQKEMAELLKTSTVLISNIVSGKRGLGPDLQRRLRELGFDVDWVLTGRRDITDGAKKGAFIARYIIPGHNKVVIETNETSEGIVIDVYAQLSDAKTDEKVFSLVAEKVEEYVEIKQEVIPAPVSKVLPAAATSIHKQT